MALVLAACDQPSANVPTEVPPPAVGVQTLAPQNVAVQVELSGRTSAFLVSEVRPQVGGIIEKRLFTEGGDVAQGDVLYQIDPATYQASLDSARASLAKAKANVVSLQSKAKRYDELVGINAVAKQDYDDAVASLKAAQADIALNAAAVKTAEINLAYTKITAPISGRIGKSSVTEGALVTASQTTALATIQDLDQIYVDVTQTSAEYLRLKRDLAEGRITHSGDNQADVTLLLEDGSTYAEKGTLQFSDVTVDQSTGSITLRAIFPNPQHDLLPGMYVRAILDEGSNDQAILAPQQAVMRDAKGEPYAYVVGNGEKVEQRAVKTERTIGDQWLVGSGLQAGDRLIIDGFQNIKPGIAVKAIDAAAASPVAQ
ncbi:efflux RND transporter periplasmic adaptor subunit [Dongia rigui]|uniref:Efflux RND transporter periplasmic adaptor subunit n=1 Tax=Dongia rigui TaxID=940149 RepID=A0ABU5E1V6_9PROT|nr:efflux RND transporter periplasmic adaptor subunit [Dongia rigui]MDY0873587.1 efflux RND transporter periplasmic adaptor subunit [Dongia rigui]